MHRDATKLENHSVIEGDICIVGAGMAGIAMALDWINTPYKVILLEGGGFNVESKMQDLYRGKNIGQRYYPLHSQRLHYFGGTSGHWAGFCSPYDPIDFKKRDWVDYSGWPIQLGDLLPYYEPAGKIVELDSANFELEHWKKTDPELAPLPLDEKVLWNKMWQFSPPTRFGTRYKDTILKARNIFLYTYANVVNLETDDSVSAVKQVHIRNLAGKEHTVKAKCFVMACCAIQNARMLLASNRQAPKGLGNDHDLVGRFFMDHLEVMTSDLFMPFAREIKLYYPWVYSETKVRAELAVTESKQTQLKILNGTASLIPKEIALNKPPNIDTFPDDAEATVQMWDKMNNQRGQENFGMPENYERREFELFTRMEQSPNPNSRIQLDKEKDELGVPRVNLDWRLSAIDKKSIRQLQEVLGEEVGRSEIGRVRLKEWLQDENNDSDWTSALGGGWHNMGTTRMSDSPSEGVVDANCKVFGLTNLFMAGSSCFTTSGAVNPTLTLLALTLRLSEHLKAGALNNFNLGRKAV
ncbi:MAG: GMC family oxidoreductase [Bacteroidetes bacterium]|nr:GMC family oxidoreductase [Bacteroidota bacterium]